MAGNPNKLAQFWQELKRRRVVHVITVYASAAFVIIELFNNLSEPLNLPANLTTIVIIVLAVGFPLVIILSWLYDMTSEGVEKTKPLSEIHEKEKPVIPNAWKIATYVSFVVIAGLVVFNIIGGTKQLRAGDIQSLVVLPFDNLTGDDQLEYFVSGMHASLIGDMGQLGGLRIISKTSSNTYKDVNMSIPEIASELGVDAVVEPTVMCLGDSICLMVRVITPYPEEKQIWIGEYKEEKSQILNLYNRITKQIAEEVKIELTPDEERLLADGRRINTEAYDAYLQAQYYWDQLGKESLHKALEYCNIAIEKEPDWAPPYAGVAKVWAGLAQMGFESPEIAGPEIFEHLKKAIDLDPDYSDSHYTSAVIAVWTEWNWEKGEKEFLKALAINPNDAYSRIYYSHLLMILQRSDEALTQGQLAVDLDPMNSLILALFVVVLGDANDYQAAYAYAEKAVAADPENDFAFHRLRCASYDFGKYDKAFEYYKKENELTEDVNNSIDRIFKEQGRFAAYEEIVNQLELLAQNSYVAFWEPAYRYHQINQYEKALDWIEKGFERHNPNMPYIATGATKLDHLYVHPRFIAILEKMNLPLPED